MRVILKNGEGIIENNSAIETRNITNGDRIIDTSKITREKNLVVTVWSRGALSRISMRHGRKLMWGRGSCKRLRRIYMAVIL